MSSQPTVDTSIASILRQPSSSLVESPSSIQLGTPIASSSTINSPAVDSTKRSARRPPSRVIRTVQIQEVEVIKTVSAEEWYEELECGVCAHVLGAPQTLVPCGHSLCGPCAWEWIKKNNNPTCPHCRHQLHDAVPFVPNIVVDQIIERKLQGLPDSEIKKGIIAERLEKEEAWKLVQAALKPPPPPRRRNLDDAVFSFFGAQNNLQSAHQRRASRYLPELGAPVAEPPHLGAVARPAVQRRPTHPYGDGMNLAEIRRHDEMHHHPTPAEIRRLREAALRNMASVPVDVAEEETPPVSPPLAPAPAPVPARRQLVFHSPSPPPAPPAVAGPSGTSNHPRSRSGSEVPLGPRPVNARGSAARSRVLADRQARGRAVQGSRDQPVMILSDSD